MTAILRLAERLADDMARNGPMRFSQFMAAALYDPAGGYYSAAPQARTGKDGDYFTSVSVGPLFGHLIAARIERFIDAQPDGTRVRVIELAAHSGSLSTDLLNHLTDRIDLILVEASPALREQLATAIPTAAIFGDIADVPADEQPTVVFSNELIDAFPVDLFIKEDGRWLEQRVAFSNGKFQFLATDPASSELPLPAAKHYRVGTLIEHRPDIDTFTSAVHHAAPNALVITIDYGFSRTDLYHPDRVGGTLQAYRQHTVVDDPLVDPGSCDLTAHVDFSTLATSFQAHGYLPTLFAAQSSYLTHLARPLLESLETSGNADISLIRQFQTLTHPGILGRSFQVLECITPHLPDAPAIAADPMTTRQRLSSDSI